MVVVPLFVVVVVVVVVTAMVVIGVAEMLGGFLYGKLVDCCGVKLTLLIVLIHNGLAMLLTHSANTYSIDTCGEQPPAGHRGGMGAYEGRGQW